MSMSGEAPLMLNGSSAPYPAVKYSVEVCRLRALWSPGWLGYVTAMVVACFNNTLL